jgi:hypothetical protein
VFDLEVVGFADDFWFLVVASAGVVWFKVGGKVVVVGLMEAFVGAPLHEGLVVGASEAGNKPVFPGFVGSLVGLLVGKLLVLCGLGANGFTAPPEAAELLAEGLIVLCGFVAGGTPAPPESAEPVEFSPPGDHESARARGKLTVNMMDRTANTAIGLRKRI